MNPSRNMRLELCPGMSRTGLILLDRSLRAVALDHGAFRILADCNGQNGGDDRVLSPLPREIMEVLQGRTWTGISGTYLNLSGVSGKYRCTLFRVEPHEAGNDSPMLAVHFQMRLSPDDAINHIARVCNLTDRELEVMKGLATGMTSKEIAAQLSISPNTVKSYVRLIMVKTGVTTRSGIVGKLLEHAAGADCGTNDGR